MTTVYASASNRPFTAEHPYYVMEEREFVGIPFILESVANVSEAGNVCEEYKLAALHEERFRDKYFFTPSHSIDEIIPLPKEFENG